jgi:hypothetical protein
VDQVPEASMTARAGDAGHRDAVTDLVAEDVGQRLQIALGPVAAGPVNIDTYRARQALVRRMST